MWFKWNSTCPLRWTLAIVGVDTVNTFPSIHTLMTRTIIHVVFTVVTLKTWNRWKRKELWHTDTVTHTNGVFIKHLVILVQAHISCPNLVSYFPHYRRCGEMWAVKKVQRVSDCLHVLMMVSIRCHHQPWPLPVSGVHAPCSVCLFNNLSQFQWLPLWQETFPVSSPVGNQKVHKVNSFCCEQSREE